MSAPSRRYEFDAAGGGTVSFRHHGRGMPTLALLAAMSHMAAAAMAHMATEARACDPRVGDRFIGLDEETVIEITAVRDVSALNEVPGTEQVVEFKDSRHATPPPPMFIGYFRTMAANAIKAGHTFHAVEDDQQ